MITENQNNIIEIDILSHMKRKNLENLETKELKRQQDLHEDKEKRKRI